MVNVNDCVNSLVKRDQYDKTRLKIICDAVSAYTCPDMVELINKSRNSKEFLDVNANIPNLLGTILKLLKLYTSETVLDNKDYKYVVFGILCKIIDDGNPDYFIHNLSITQFAEYFDDVFDIFMLVPNVIGKVKTSCKCF